MTVLVGVSSAVTLASPMTEHTDIAHVKSILAKGKPSVRCFRPGSRAVVEARELVGTTSCLYWVRAYWVSTVREAHRLQIGVAYLRTLIRCTWLLL